MYDLSETGEDAVYPYRECVTWGIRMLAFYLIKALYCIFPGAVILSVFYLGGSYPFYEGYLVFLSDCPLQLYSRKKLI